MVVYNSLMAIAGVPSMMVLGPALFRKFGVRATMLAGGLWLAASLASVALVTNLVTLWMLGLAAGLTFGAVTFMAGSVLITNWFVAHRGAIMGAAFAASGLGGIAAGLILPPLVSRVGWQGGFLSLAGLVVVAVVLPSITLVRSTPENAGLRAFGAHHPHAETHGRPTHAGVPARMAFRSPQFAALSLALVLVGAAHALELHFAPVMMEHGVTLEVAGVLLSLMALSTVASNALLGVLNDRRGTPTAVALSLGLQTLAFVAIMSGAGVIPLAVGSVLFAFGLALPATLAPILVVRLFGTRDFAAILGPVTAMVPAGLAIGTPLWGIAVDVTASYAAALVVSMLMTILAGALILWALKSASRSARRES